MNNLRIRHMPIFRMPLFCGLAVLIGISFMAFIADNLLWSVYFCFLLIIGLVYSLTPFKQRMLICLLVLTIPFNIHKIFGAIVIDPVTGLITYPSGIKSLGYLSINEILIFLLFSASLLLSVIHKEKLLRSKTDKVFLFYLLTIFISVILSYDSRGFGLKAIREGVYYFVIYYFVSRNFRVKDNIRDTFYCLSFIIAFEIAICTFQVMHINIPFVSIIGGNPEGMEGFSTVDLMRLCGSFGSPNGFSSFMVMVLPVTLSCGLFLRGKKQFIAYFLCLLGVLMVFFSLSRSGWLALVIEVLLFVFVGTHILPRWFYNKLLWTLGIASFAAFIVLNWHSIYFRINSDESRTAAISRINQSQTAEYYVRTHPIFGIGDGNYEVNLNATDRRVNEDSSGFIVHNIYLKVFAERGLVGIVCYLGLYFVIIRRLTRIIKSRHAHSIIAVGLLAAIVGHMIQNMVEVAEIVETIALVLFFIFGVASSIDFGENKLYHAEQARGRL